MKGYNRKSTYFEWLKGQVEYFTEIGEYDFLFKRLHSREFYALIQNDQNRYGDGIALRDEYYGFYPDSAGYIFDGPCSFLEFLIALSRRMSFICSKSDEDLTADCFWQLIANLGLATMTDIDYLAEGGDMVVDQAIDRVLQRNYSPNGVGGLFPMENARHDQRNVEIWYQMNQYITERMEN